MESSVGVGMSEMCMSSARIALRLEMTRTVSLRSCTSGLISSSQSGTTRRMQSSKDSLSGSSSDLSDAYSASFPG